jgi:two-component system nitrate/nitrite response regulator NarL
VKRDEGKPLGDIASTQKPARGIRLLVADTNRMGAHLLADALARNRGCAVAEFVSASQEVLPATQRLKPDVLLISANLDNDPRKGFQVLQLLQSVDPRPRAVLLLDNSTREAVLEAFQSGARGIFCRSESMEALWKCITCVHGGQVWANSTEISFVLDAMLQAPPVRVVGTNGASLLSERELMVVRCLTSGGLTNREIAAELKLSEHTVKNYLFRIYDKLGVSSRVEVILYALSQRASALDPAVAEAEGNGRSEGHAPVSLASEDGLGGACSRPINAGADLSAETSPREGHSRGLHAAPISGSAQSRSARRLPGGPGATQLTS